VSADAIAFIRAVLAKSAGQRPPARELLHHPWLRPHLVGMTNGVAGLDAAALRCVCVWVCAYARTPCLRMHQSACAWLLPVSPTIVRPCVLHTPCSAFRAVPSLVASSSNALVAAAAKAASAAAAAAAATASAVAPAAPAANTSSSGGTVFAAAAAAAAAGAGASSHVGRSASFSSVPSRAPGAPAGLFINVDAPRAGAGAGTAAAAAAGAAAHGGCSSSCCASPAGSSGLAHHLQGLAVHFGGQQQQLQAAGSGSGSSGVGGSMCRGASPSTPLTPGPYGPPGMFRKPIWEA
jgi:hypothetical protein